ncbi:ATP-dependent RNA helicase DHX30 [Ptiloglossa arizonensis]|uniref:ATP-dependent RNA helicase DHX30 n=1 Tax=Ptiloglossa arizonensis TaxID=3350558 RepID=UPI003FA11B48
MFMLQVTSTLRKSVSNYELLYLTGQLYKTCFEETLIYSRIFYRSYKKKATTLTEFNCFEELKLSKNEETNENDIKIDHTQYDGKSSKLNIEQLFPNPLCSLTNIYNSVNHEFDKKESLSIKYESNNVKSDKMKMKCIIDVQWPSEMSFIGIGPNKKITSLHAAKKCLTWLYTNQMITTSKPVLYSKNEIQTLLKKPIRIDLRPEFRDEIETIVNSFDNVIKDIVEASSTTNSEDVPSSEIQYKSYLSQMEPQRVDTRNYKLAEELKNKEHNTDLPIFNYKSEILDAIEKNQVVLIKGGTGCGKSTQVPQYIFDAFTENNNACNCNILVSEPRQVSATSLAVRVADERNEKVGKVVGYHVRLKHCIPRMSGSILYCTTGILLQKIRINPTLLDVSHVILDEAHERSLQIDILLNLLKGLLKINPSLKLIIMSATVNAKVFEQYYSCAVVDIPGKIYPVKMHFMDEIDVLIKSSSIKNVMDREVPVKKVVALINWIRKNKPPGAILCFLPGWHEIKLVESLLRNRSDLLILPFHSKLNYNEQQQVFCDVPENIQKIILATDIAESSITIRDVSYVIDTALKKLLFCNEIKGTTSINTVLISQANLLQRRGRAGRVKPGESYHLISKATYKTLELYPEPEIHRAPLDQTIIISKIYSNQKVKDFFNNMLEPPNEISILQAVESLETFGILDENECLTNLGKRIIHFTLDTSLSRALVFSCVFQCLNPILTIASMNTTDNEISSITLKNKSHLRNEKVMYHNTSDHIAMYKFYNNLYIDNESSLKNLVYKNFEILPKIRRLHLEEVVSSGMISSPDVCNDINLHSNHNELIRAILFSATNRIIKFSPYGYKKNCFTKTANVFISQDNSKVALGTESVNFKRQTWPSQFMTYLNKMEHIKQRTCVVSDTSIISPLSVLLFNQIGFTSVKRDSNSCDKTEDVIITINNLKNVQLSCDAETAELLLKLRDRLWIIVDYIIQYEGKYTKEHDLAKVKSYRDQLVALVSKMLKEHSKSIDNVQKH